MGLAAFRCDGGARIGAGHVARCLQVALACRAGGLDVVFAGAYDGVARRLLEDAGMPTGPAHDGPAGLPDGIDWALVDSYAVPAAEMAAATAPVAVVSDGASPPEGVVAVEPHVDASPDSILAGPAYAPIAPAFAAARRDRDGLRALVTVGGGESGGELRARAGAALAEAGFEVDVPGANGDAPVGLADAVRAADVAVSAAGVTAYELACAGVPSVLVPVADNQLRIAGAFDRAGLAIAGDVSLPEGVAALADPRRRARLAANGPAAVDGYGAFRIRDALTELFAGRPLPRRLLYRPALAADAAALLDWRNDPVSRAASWSGSPIAPAEHERWLTSVLADPDRELLVVEGPDGPVGSLRFDRVGEEAEVSVVVAPEARGDGLAADAVREASELQLAARPELVRIRAQLRASNEASLKSFERAGFAPGGDAGPGRRVLFRDRAALASRAR